MKDYPDLFNQKKPVLALAPMDGYTDCAFREIVKKYSSPDLVFTEFVNCQGLVKAFENLVCTLRYTEKQRPVIAQLFGKDPKCFYKSALLLCLLGFDGIDINMGCPAKNVALKGGGAALIKKTTLAVEVVNSIKKAVRDYQSKKYVIDTGLLETVKIRVKEWNIGVDPERNITLSVKTRLGYDRYEPNWFKCLDKEKIDFLSVHARTYKQKFTGKADWKTLRNIASMINTPIIGNGDVKDVKDTPRLVKQTGCSGVMIGRGAIGRPWVFHREKNYNGDKDMIKKVVLEHAEAFKMYSGDSKFYNLRKHFAQYIRGFRGAKKLRERIVRVSSLEELKKVLSD